METPYFIDCAGYQLFAVLHEPGPAAQGRRAFVFCHALAEEKLWTHRVFVSFARTLAAAGHAVLRLDLPGNGDSDGDFSDATVDTAIAGVECAIDELRARTGGAAVTLLGLRFGATVASLVAEKRDDVEALVLWAPIVDGERYMQELLRSNVATQTAVYKEVRHDRTELVEQMRGGATVNVDGYELSYALYAQAAAIKLAEGAKSHRGPCLVVAIDRQSARIPADLQALAASYPHGTIQSAQEEPFWKEIARFYDTAPSLFAVTTAWLGAVPGPPDASGTA